MYELFLISAVVGGTVLAVQFLLQLFFFGFDSADAGEHNGADAGDLSLDGGDVHHAAGDHQTSDAHDAHAAASLKLLTMQTLAAFLTFFGLGGLASLSAGQTRILATVVASSLGVGAMYLVAYLVRGLFLLQSEGTVNLRRVVGVPGRVYLRIPGEGRGEGKVSVVVQGRTVELRAKTDGPELATGASVVVDRLLDGQTALVVPRQASLESEAAASS